MADYQLAYEGEEIDKRLGMNGAYPIAQDFTKWNCEVWDGAASVTLPDIPADRDITCEIRHIFTGKTSMSYTAPDFAQIIDEDGTHTGLGGTYNLTGLTAAKYYEVSLCALRTAQIAIVVKEWTVA